MSISRFSAVADCISAQAQYDKAKQRALLNPGDSTAFASAAAANAAATSAPRQPFGTGPPQGTPLRASSTASFAAPNRVNLGWGAHLQGGQGGSAGVPLAHNPGNSGQRPRRSLHEQQNQHAGGGMTGAGFGGGAGLFGAGAGGGRGIAPMPHQRSGGSNASGSSGGGSGGGAFGAGGHVGQQQQQQQLQPEFLGQQAGAAKRGECLIAPSFRAELTSHSDSSWRRLPSCCLWCRLAPGAVFQLPIAPPSYHFSAQVDQSASSWYCCRDCYLPCICLLFRWSPSASERRVRAAERGAIRLGRKQPSLETTCKD